MNATITTLLSLLTTIIGGLTDSTQIASVIATLQQIIESGIAEVEAVAPINKNIIAALQSNTAVTADQMTQLEAQDAAVDAAFDAAAAAAGVPSTS